MFALDAVMFESWLYLLAHSLYTSYITFIITMHSFHFYSALCLWEHRSKLLLANQLHRGVCLYMHIIADNDLHTNIIFFLHVSAHLTPHPIVPCCLSRRFSLPFFPALQTLLVQVWYPMTVCTNSRAQKEIIAKVTENVFNYLYCHSMFSGIFSCSAWGA